MKRSLFPYSILPAALWLCGCLSCSADPDLVSLWCGDASPPTMLSVIPRSSSRVELLFSAPVTLAEAEARLDDEGPGTGEDLGATWIAGESALSISLDFSRAVPVGARAVIDGSVADGNGNTLSFAVPFTGYNDRPARLEINEVRADYSKPKAEYVEFLVVAAGNLAGIEIVNARNEKNPSVELPAAEVAAGDYVVWHLRSVDEGIVTELGAVDVSAGVDSYPSARDIWDDQTSAPLKPTNVILVRERRDGEIMAALTMAEAALAAWPNAACEEAAREASISGAWPSGSTVADAVRSDGMSPTRTLGRGAGEASDPGSWAVCPTGKCSPGRENWAP